MERADIGARLRAAWEQARPYPDGRWLFVSVDDEATAAGIERAVAVKSSPPRHPRPRPAIGA